MKRYDAYINGAWVKPSSNHWFDTTYPYTGEVWAQVAHCGTEEVNAAVNAAKRAFESEWSQIKPSQRGRMLMKLADLVEENAAHLAEMETRDSGKVYKDSLMQVGGTADYFRYYGGLADKIEGAVIPVNNANMLTFTRYEPFGVVAIITPWNSPLSLMSAKLAPALAAGNVAVIKPSSFTSVSTLEFIPLIEKAGFPAGVVNVVTGFGNDVGIPLVAHADVARIAFTGSEMAGQNINEAAAKDFKSVMLELGGKSPTSYLKTPISTPRPPVLWGHLQVYRTELRCRLAPSAAKVDLRPIHGTGARGGTWFHGRRPYVAHYDDRAGNNPTAVQKNYGLYRHRQEGRRNLYSGRRTVSRSRRCGQQMVEPTIFVDVNNSMRIAQEEVFGPVLAVIPFDTEEEAIAIANDIRFGLAAGLWTRDLGRANRVCERLQAGTVWINTYKPGSYAVPSGGYKRSGIGRENGMDAIKEYLHVKSVWIAT